MTDTIKTDATHVINRVVARDLCISCGICRVVCPMKCITVAYHLGDFLPQIDNRCTNCGLCIKTCPAVDTDFHALGNIPIDTPDLLPFGQPKAAYVAWSRDLELRRNSGSGGLATEILTNLLERNEVDKVFVVTYGWFSGEQAKSEAVSHPEEIAGAARSKYVAVDISEVARVLLEQPEYRIALVATPCHIHGLLKFMELKRISRGRVKFIGLICGRTMNYRIYDYLQANFCGRARPEWFDFKHKGKYGYPGDMRFIQNKNTFFVKEWERKAVRNYFTNHRCLYCFDKINQLADVSLGDYFIADKMTKDGESSLIVWTECGRRIVDCLREHVEMESVEYAQMIDLHDLRGRRTQLKRGCSLGLYPGVAVDPLSYEAQRELDRLKSMIEVGRNLRNPRRLHRLLKLKRLMAYFFNWIRTQKRSW